MKTPPMDISFIWRTLKTSGILALIILAFGLYYFETYRILSIFFGMMWGIINLYFLMLLIRVTVRPEGPDKQAAALLMLVKLPLLYLSGYFLITIPRFELTYLVIGFSIIFAVIILKIAGRVLLGIDDKERRQGDPGQEAV
jgi:hypothetical protein